MPSLNIFRIQFDRADAVYIPGECVSGFVIIDLANEKLAEELKLSAKGEANVSWDEESSSTDSNGNSTTTTTTYRANEKYFKLTISLLEKSEDDGKVHIPAGLSRYPFCIQLPCDLPCSFEHHVGHIRYTIKAVIVRSWRFNHECKAAYTVITIYDLNIRREQCIGIDDEVNQSFSCLCCVSDGSINAHIKLPMTGFVPGQWIEAILDLRHNATITELQKICVKLQQSLEFRADAPFGKKKKDKATVATVQKITPFDKHAIALRLFIPPIPPSDLQFCDIIDLKYILRIVLHSKKMYRKIVKEYPILIGTIPLRFIPSAPAASSSSDVFPSTSKKEDVTPESNIVPSPSTPSLNDFVDAPPSYEESLSHRVSCIRDPKDSIYVHGVNEPFAPKYPVFKYFKSS
ncbi:arrestin domain-containing protein 17-like [Temnothorax americanus]|uniref:arrestin domain-containing protein 17-like n=1 Tax=Temnothorax americanus TaxID=1964332 RepID=UPI00406902F3